LKAEKEIWSEIGGKKMKCKAVLKLTSAKILGDIFCDNSNGTIRLIKLIFDKN
jgi:hypothetical protein